MQDDERFTNHIKLLQSTNPEDQKKLTNFTNTRKLLIKDITDNIKDKSMFEIRLFLVDHILSTIKIEDVESMKNTIDDWIDMKHDVESLASLQFNQDRTLLSRLKSFQFNKTELKIMLYSNEIDFKNNQENNANENVNGLTVEQLESLNDRLLVYTVVNMSESLPAINNKELTLWTNHNIVQFFESKLATSSVIHLNERDSILMLLKQRNINGKDLFETDINIKQLANVLSIDEFENVSENNLRKDVILREILKIIQVHIMTSQVNDVIAKFDVAKKIQSIRLSYHRHGGRDHLNTKYNEITITNNSQRNFEKILLRWKFYLHQWKNEI
eukprot:467829_1